MWGLHHYIITYICIYDYIYMAFHCIQTTIVMNCQMIWEMFPAFQSLKLVSFINTPRSRVQGTFHLGGHTNIGPTIRCCDAAFLSFPHMYCLLLRKMQDVHRICFAVITAVRGDFGKHHLWLSQTNSNIKQIKHFRSWIPASKKSLYTSFLWKRTCLNHEFKGKQSINLCETEQHRVSTWRS